MSVAPTCCGRSDMFWDSGPACRTSCLRPLLRRERHSTCEKCPIILHDGNFPRWGGRSRVLMQFNDFCKRGTNEEQFTTRIHLSYIVMPGYLGTRECRRRGCVCATRLASVNITVFLIAASGCLMNFLYPYFPPLYNFIAKFPLCAISNFIWIWELIYVHSQFVDDKWCVYFKIFLV